MVCDRWASKGSGRVLGLGLFWLIGCMLAVSNAQAASDSEWTTVNQGYSAERHLVSDQITSSNIRTLGIRCKVELNEPAWFGSGILKIDHTLYVTTLRATYAIGASDCRPIWRAPVHFRQPLASHFATRGAAYLGGVLFRGTNDGQLLALDAATGRTLWSQQVANPAANESVVAAPIAWEGKVYLGIATSDAGIKGRVLALEALSGKTLWTFNSIDMGNELGGGFWTSFALDTDSGTLYAPVSNPVPIFYPEARPGPNLHSNSVIGLDARTGKLKSAYQALPGDAHDWDLSATPTLFASQSGRSLFAVTGKSGVVYGVERDTSQPVFATPGTTLFNENVPLTSDWLRVCPGAGAQYNGVARLPGQRLLFVGMADWCRYFKSTPPSSATDYAGGSTTPDYSTQPQGVLTALDESSGKIRWQLREPAPIIAGLVTTSSGLLMAADVRGNFLGIEAKTGNVLKRLALGGAMNNGLIAYTTRKETLLAATVGGSSITTAGIAGPLNVTIMALGSPRVPLKRTFSRLLPEGEQVQMGEALYLTVCGNCHGKTGGGGLYPSLMRHGSLADPHRLKKFLAYVTPPMPRLYPGLLKGGEVALIAQYLKTQIFKCGQPGGVDCSAPGKAASAGAADWRKIYAVMTSPRCLNCHTYSSPQNPSTQDFPRQSDDRRPHYYGVSRGTDNQGLGNGRCGTCHGLENNPVTGAPGAQKNGSPIWQLAPTSMAWESAPGQPMPGHLLCTMIKDPALNGGLDFKGLLQHVIQEPLVSWAWNPGIDARGLPRTRPPISHEAFVRVFAHWLKSGAPCPKMP